MRLSSFTFALALFLSSSSAWPWPPSLENFNLALGRREVNALATEQGWLNSLFSEENP